MRKKRRKELDFGFFSYSNIGLVFFQRKEKESMVCHMALLLDANRS